MESSELLSSSREFALESYEVEALGYLLKPFQKSVLRSLLSRIFKIERKKRVAIKIGRQYRYPYTDQILYVDSNAHTVTFHLTDGREITNVYHNYFINNLSVKSE